MTSSPTYGRHDPDHLRMSLGQALKFLRESNGLTQREVASSVGWEYYTIVSQIESGRMRIPPESVPLLANALNVPHEALGRATWVAYDPVTWQIVDGRKPTAELIGLLLGVSGMRRFSKRSPKSSPQKGKTPPSSTRTRAIPAPS